ncbi:hypothetical protein JK636_01485 [Clostridium sp. YIM B02515]|uniref:Uncharacterized protein n=1 Tax=Clostridium rhizosphaerae TaxID=2803861 RepID=A0ABS1T524_9CLOT|nr:hypothetical protein [Clostridium rhizosphaerae]MBL4934425.1 hypothetical protein [Clostridium rhizosphaerae]
MYVLFGNNVVDSKEMKEAIENNSEFKVVKDMSKGSKREDILAYNLSISLDVLNDIMKEEDEFDINELSEGELTEDDIFDEYLNLAEEIATELEEVVPEESILDIRAYKWDKSDNDIKLVIAIAHEDLGESKLGNAMRTLLTQVE